MINRKRTLAVCSVFICTLVALAGWMGIATTHAAGGGSVAQSKSATAPAATDLVDINLNIRILLGSSYYDDWEKVAASMKEMWSGDISSEVITIRTE